MKLFSQINEAYNLYKQEGMVQTIVTVIYHFNLLEITVGVLNLIIPKNKFLWVFSSDHGFSENSKYLFLHISNKYPNIKTIWISKNKDTILELRQEGYNAYHTWSPKGLILQLRSYISCSTHLSDQQVWSAFYYRSKRIYLDHASYRILGLYPNNYGFNSWMEKKIYDLTYTVMPGKNRQLELYDKYEPLWYTNTNLLPLGFPKNDVLYQSVPGEKIGSNNQLIEEIKNQSKNIIFYMPTKIMEKNVSQNNLFCTEDNLTKLDEMLENNNAIMYIKLHPDSPNLDYEFDKLNNVCFLNLDIDAYPLLRNIDIFISDYSSTLVDALHLDIPIILFPYDLKQEGPEDEFDTFGYTRRGGLCINYNEMQFGPVVTNVEELISNIEKFLIDPNLYRENRQQALKELFDYHDGKSSKRIAQELLSELD